MINKLQFYTYTRKDGWGAWKLLGTFSCFTSLLQSTRTTQDTVRRVFSHQCLWGEAARPRLHASVCITVLQNGGRTQPQHARWHGTVWLYIQYLHILIKFHNLICIYCIFIMLVPGIHSDSKIKLQEEVCTRDRRVWVTGIPSSLCPDPPPGPQVPQSQSTVLSAGLWRAASAFLFLFPRRRWGEAVQLFRMWEALSSAISADWHRKHMR